MARAPTDPGPSEAEWLAWLRKQTGSTTFPTVPPLIRMGEDRPRPLLPDEIVELVDRADPAEL